jgi:large conductance mechanosensitive channel
MGMIKEFKEFAMKGNVMDLAVAVIIGAAFGKIVTALVENVLMPLIGMVSGGVNFSGLKATVGDTELTYGIFVQAVIDFIIVAFCIFMIIKMMNKAQNVVSGPEDEPEAEPEKTPEDIELLREIRDSLKK